LTESGKHTESEMQTPLLVNMLHKLDLEQVP
jgi:hypothetical protein